MNMTGAAIEILRGTWSRGGKNIAKQFHCPFGRPDEQTGRCKVFRLVPTLNYRGARKTTAAWLDRKQ
jgi:hypothetical protein